jgi:uncharacterized membrane protein YhdT
MKVGYDSTNLSEWHVTGKTPSQREAYRLAGIPLRRVYPDRQTRRRARKVCAIACAALTVAIWLVCLLDGTLEGGDEIFALWLTAAIILVPLFFFTVGGSFRRAFCALPTKTPEKLLYWMFAGVIMNVGAGATDSARLLMNVMPEEIKTDTDSLAAYIETFRVRLFQEITETRQRIMAKWEAARRQGKVQLYGSMEHGSPNRKLTVNGMRELYPGVWEVSAALRYEDNLRKYANWEEATDRTGDRLTASATTLHIAVVLVNSGKYWFPYDLRPELTKGDEG